MLKIKEPNVVPDYVGAFKLITGEEIIAQVTKETATSYSFHKPLSMVMAENPDNPQQTRVMFTPWMVAAGDNDVEVLHQHIVAMSAARADASEQYKTAIK